LAREGKRRCRRLYGHWSNDYRRQTISLRKKVLGSQTTKGGSLPPTGGKRQAQMSDIRKSAVGRADAQTKRYRGFCEIRFREGPGRWKSGKEKAVEGDSPSAPSKLI